MQKKIPAVAVVHDLSGIGRCALSVALPTLSVLGAQVCALPTALLSAHTLFPGVTPRDESAFLEQALCQWRRLDRTFDAIYTGYLAQPGQAALLADFLSGQKTRGLSLAVVDPAMGDHGRLYRAVSAQMPQAMRALCALADLIVPNPTEAALLTDSPFLEKADPAQAWRLMKALTALGCGGALVTGLALSGGGAANLLYLRGQEGFWACRYQPLPCAFPGTGDLFAAALTGFMLSGYAPQQSMARATAFVYQAMARTVEAGTPPREGVGFEPLLAAIGAVEPMPLDFIRTSGSSPDRSNWDC